MKKSLGLKSSYAQSNLKKIKIKINKEINKSWNSSSIPIVAFRKTYSGVFNKFDILGSRSLIAAF